MNSAERHSLPRSEAAGGSSPSNAGLGRAGATVTLNTYAHLWPSAEDRTRTAVTGMLVEDVLTNQ